MSRIRSSWTGPEKRLYQAMQDVGLDPRTHDKQLPGRPDFVFDGERPLAVLVEGCHWHACPKHYKRPKTNKKFWDKKIRDNVARDHRNRRKLNKLGIRVMRIWEHDVTTVVKATRKALSIKKRLCARN